LITARFIVIPTPDINHMRMKRRRRRRKEEVKRTE